MPINTFHTYKAVLTFKFRNYLNGDQDSYDKNSKQFTLTDTIGQRIIDNPANIPRVVFSWK